MDEENPQGTYEVQFSGIKIEGARPKAFSIPSLEIEAADLKEYMLKRILKRELRRMRMCKKTLDQIDKVSS